MFMNENEESVFHRCFLNYENSQTKVNGQNFVICDGSHFLYDQIGLNWTSNNLMGGGLPMSFFYYYFISNS